MLQKGFLKNQSKKETKTSVVKTSRLILFLGVIVMFSAVFYMMTNIRQADVNINMWLSVMIAGICLIFVSLWLNFFAQYKDRKTKFKH